MNPFNTVKNVIAINLEKAGYSLQDFESALSTLNTGEGVLQVTKIASIIGNPITDTINGATSLVGGTFLPVTMGAGGLLGLGLDAADGTVKSQNKKLNDMRRSIDMMKKMKHNLATENGIEEK
jgi:hypothetical protein